MPHGGKSGKSGGKMMHEDAGSMHAKKASSANPKGTKPATKKSSGGGGGTQKY